MFNLIFSSFLFLIDKEFLFVCQYTKQSQWDKPTTPAQPAPTQVRPIIAHIQVTKYSPFDPNTEQSQPRDGSDIDHPTYS